MEESIVEGPVPREVVHVEDSDEKVSTPRRRARNETKNIPKNYGKAMITFIIARTKWIKEQFGEDVSEELVKELKIRKDNVNSIVHLK